MQVEYLARAHGSNAFVGAHSNFVVVTGASRGLNHGVHRDIKEMLIGSAAIALFGTALIAWPPLAGYIRAIVGPPLHIVLTMFN